MELNLLAATVSNFQSLESRKMEMRGALEMNRILFDHSTDAYELSRQMVDAIEVRFVLFLKS